MSLFQRAHDILAAKTNKALDAAEKPDEMLDLSYEQMLDQITKVRQALVTIAASRKRIELQEQHPACNRAINLPCWWPTDWGTGWKRTWRPRKRSGCFARIRT